MEEEINKLETPESLKSNDRVSHRETISSIEQNKEHIQALASNPDQFPSIANLQIPNRDLIEPFQIVDGEKQIASSRTIKSEQAGSITFHDGLKALGPDATDEDKAQYQIEYIERKAGTNDSSLLIKTGITQNQELGWYEAGQAIAQLPFNLQLSIIGNVLMSGANQIAYEQHERSAGSIIGTVQGIGSVAFNLASIADFSAYCILGDERALEMGDKFGEALGKTLVSGIRLFQAADKYLYDIGFNQDYSKPFIDVISVGMALNESWSQLPPREQERLKSELIAQMVADGFIGHTGTQTLTKAKSYLEFLDAIALKAVENSGCSLGNIQKTIDTVKVQITSLLSPQLELAGAGKIKMRDLEQIKEDLALKMAGKQSSKAYRGDSDFHAKFDKNGLLKSHINEAGDLVPADIKGLFNGKPVDIMEHICDFHFQEQKAHSPFISLSTVGELTSRFGNQKLKVDLTALRAAIKDGSLTGTELIEHPDLLRLIDNSSFDLNFKKMAKMFVQGDKEMLAKGPIPARFLEILE